MQNEKESTAIEELAEKIKALERKLETYDTKLDRIIALAEKKWLD